MFDPEKVERKEGMTWDLSEHGGRECVLASDYDQLLKMYKAVLGSLPKAKIGLTYAGVGPRPHNYKGYWR